MTLRVEHRYLAEVLAPAGQRLGNFELATDFTPAAECSHLLGVRGGALPVDYHHGPCVVEPVFDEATGRPYVAGIRMRFDAADPDYEPPVIPRNYFQSCVEGGASRLVREGRLGAGEPFVYRICAYPMGPKDRASAVTADVGGIQPARELDRVPLTPRIAGATRISRIAWNAQDLPVFVRPEVIEEAAELARTAGDRETGGILVGHLYRDSESPELHAEITAQIPAALADAGHAHLNFSPRTWSAVNDALALRRLNEIYLGWWHFHPFFCRQCDPANRRHCPLSRPFFSRDDCELHRTVFDAAFSIALLLSDVGGASPRYDWFGWRYGSIDARGCYLLAGHDPSFHRRYEVGESASVAPVLSLLEKPHEH